MKLRWEYFELDTATFNFDGKFGKTDKEKAGRQIPISGLSLLKIRSTAPGLDFSSGPAIVGQEPHREGMMSPRVLVKVMEMLLSLVRALFTRRADLALENLALRTIQHDATMMRGAWVIEVDIRRYFDTLNHAHVRDILSQRVAGRGLSQAPHSVK